MKRKIKEGREFRKDLEKKLKIKIQKTKVHQLFQNFQKIVIMKDKHKLVNNLQIK